MTLKPVSKAVLLYIILLSVNITQGKKPRLPGLVDRKSKILNECGRCKVLTDSFDYWQMKTSRGKYEGGDAAWEESKLKSYARSEIRLVEIQEGLCSELTKYQDYCYILAEEAEQVLEKWWFHEGPDSIDLYTWLCIQTLKHCCPVNHFGDTCSPCPIVDSKICNGNGICDGDGTREGSGACICQRGYTGKSCENCAENFFAMDDGSCEQCHQACSGCIGKEPSACHSCKPGWQLQSGVCVDIDECLFQTSCKTNEICINKEGSFKCKLCDTSCLTCAGMGSKNCTSCESPSVLWGGMCISREQQDDIIGTAIRLIIYIGITIIAAIIQIRFRKVLYLYFVVITAVISYLEPAYMNTLDVLKILISFNLHDLYEVLSNVITKLSISSSSFII